MGNCSSSQSAGTGRAPAADTTHEVIVKTGDKKGAETDGNVSFTFVLIYSGDTITLVKTQYEITLSAMTVMDKV